MGFLNSEGLEYLVNKLSDSSNIKIAGNPNGTRVGAVVDKLVEKTDTVTGAVDMEIENEVGSFKVGTGLGSTDVSATVEDGFSEIEIKGNTVQNLVLEDNVEVVPSGAMVSAEATSLKLDTASGNVDMSIKGRTLQNLSPRKSLPTRYSYLVSMIKPSTTYTVIYNYENQNESGGRLRVQFETTGQPTVYFGERVYTLGMGLSMYSFVSPSTFERSIILAQSYEVDGTFNTDNIMILEGDYTNTPLSELPYIEGIQSVGEQEDNVVEVKSCGKNLLDDYLLYDKNMVTIVEETDEYIITEGIENIGGGIKFEKVKVKPNTKYTFSITCRRFQEEHNASVRVYQPLKKEYITTHLVGIPISEATIKGTFTTPPDCDDIITIWLGKQGQFSEITRFKFKKDWMLEESPTATPYEPYQGDTAQITLEEPLRSLPNGVCDEIKDGKLIRRVGKIILNGSEAWNYDTAPSNIDLLGFSYRIGDAKGFNGALLSDRFKQFETYGIEEGLKFNNGVNVLMAIIKKSKLVSQNIDGFKQWLQANPTTVYYELAEPVITELGQSINLDTYIGTTHMTSTNYLSPKIKVNSKGKAYETLLKPNTDYTVKWRAAEGGANLDLNLGGTAKTVGGSLGSTTIKTPDALIDSNLYIAGWNTKVKDVMVIEGDHTNNPNLPSYADGIQGVGDKSKNLFNGEFELGRWTYTVGKKIEKTTNTSGFRTSNIIKVEPDISYVVQGDLKSKAYAVLVDENDIITRLQSLGANAVGTKITTTENERAVAFYTVDTSIQPTDFQIEESSTATPYEPYYDGHKIEILSSGKNLFSYKSIIPRNGNSVISIDGDSVSVTDVYYCGNIMKVERNTDYYLHAERTIISGNGGAIAVFASDGKSVGGQTAVKKFGTGNGIFNSGNNDYVSILLYGGMASVGTCKFSKVQIEKSSIQTEKEIYKEDKSQILLDEPLMKLPNGVADEISGGKLIRRIGKVVFDGGYDYTSDVNKNGYIRFKVASQQVTESLNIKLIRDNPLISDNFSHKTDAWSNDPDSEGIVLSNSPAYGIMFIKNKGILSEANANGFKQWLSENPTTVYYELATPVETELPTPNVRLFKDGHLTFNTLVAPTSTHKVLLNKSAQIEQSVREIQSLDSRVGKLESFYDEMILETSHKLNLLDLDFDYIRESEEV